MFIPRSIKRKHNFIDNHEKYINKKQVLDKDQSKSNQLSTTTHQKEKIVTNNAPNGKVDHDSYIKAVNNNDNDNMDDNIDNMNIPTTTVTTTINENISNDNEIKRFSSQQRLVQPNEEEPTCIICGKYGEYINDDTDHDICRYI